MQVTSDAALQSAWSLVDLGVGPPPYGGAPKAIARNGLIGGLTSDPSGATAFVRRHDGTYVLLPKPSGFYSAQVNRVNSRGLATGVSLSARVGGTSTGMLWSTEPASIVREVPSGWGYAVSETGYLVGQLSISGSRTRAFRWREDTGFEELRNPVGSLTQVFDVNDSGAAAGSVFIYASFWRTPNDVSVLPLPSGIMSATARAINSRGDLAIHLLDVAANSRIGRWTSKRGLELLNTPPNFWIAEVIGIDDAGRVYANLGDAVSHQPYVWFDDTLLPLPATSPTMWGGGVNACGQVVGTDGRSLHMVLWDTTC